MTASHSRLPSDFSPERYRAIYDDLSHLTPEQLKEHWIMHGQAEGRRYSGPSRKELIMAGMGPERVGIEIAPYFRPLAPKKLGYNVKTVDVFPRDELRKQALADPMIPDELVSSIEEVDFVGSAGNLRQLLEAEVAPSSLDYIVSSHNFEHLPNPVQFLVDSQHFLSKQGVLSMAIPDLRCCFDFFQWPTMIDEWLSSYLRQKTSPSPSDVFRMRCRLASNFGYLDYPREKIELIGDLAHSFAEMSKLMNGNDQDVYTDAHCSFFTPASFRLLVRELRFLGITCLDVADISATFGNEFIVQLCHRPEDKRDRDSRVFIAERKKLLFDVISEIAFKDETKHSSDGMESSVQATTDAFTLLGRFKESSKRLFHRD